MEAAETDLAKAKATAAELPEAVVLPGVPLPEAFKQAPGVMEMLDGISDLQARLHSSLQAWHRETLVSSAPESQPTQQAKEGVSRKTLRTWTAAAGVRRSSCSLSPTSPCSLGRASRFPQLGKVPQAPSG